MGGININASMMRCEMCRETFVCYGTDWWAYKVPRRDIHLYFCSWKCLRRYEKEFPTNNERIDNAIRDGLNDYEIRMLLKVTQRQVDKGRIRAKEREEQEKAGQDGPEKDGEKEGPETTGDEEPKKKRGRKKKAETKGWGEDGHQEEDGADRSAGE